MILYFSATGNSQYIAEKLADHLDDEIVNLLDPIKSGERKNFHSNKPYVIVSPTHAWRMPRFVTSFLKTCTFSGTKDIYVILNYGDSCKAAINYLKRDFEEMNLDFKGLYGIQMPENYLMLFDLAEDEVNREIVNKADSEILNAAKIIASKNDFNKEPAGLTEKVFSGIMNEFFYKFTVDDKDFYYTDKCIKCGICKKVCPMNNITYEDGYPKWNGECTHCASCINKCPKEAIEYGEKTKSRRRYLLKNIMKQAR